MFHQPLHNDIASPSRGSIPGSYGRLAGRMWGWTSNLLATALVLVAGLGLGRQVVGWWHADAAPPREPASLLAASDQTYEMQFGDSPLAMTTQSFEGDVKGTLERMRRTLAFVSSKNDAMIMSPPGAAEQRLLDSLASQRPVEVIGTRRIYEQAIGLPMVVVVDQPEGEAPRATAWGLAMPRREREWTLHTFRANTGSAGTSPTNLGGEVPLPPGSQRTMSLKTEEGGMLAAFQGAGNATDWVDFYRRWAKNQPDWNAVGDWVHRGRSWQARYTHAGSPVRSVDVHFSVNDDGKISGLISESGTRD